MKFHVQLERTIDITVDAPDKNALTQVLGGMSTEDINNLADKNGDKWVFFLSQSGLTPARWTVVHDTIQETNNDDTHG